MSTALSQADAPQLEDLEQMSGHTLMLIQFVSNEESRTYIDTKGPNECFEALCRFYESYAIQKGGLPQKVEYELRDLLQFVDQLFDLSMMIFNHKAAGYTCHGKPWIKGMLHVYLRKLA